MLAAFDDTEGSIVDDNVNFARPDNLDRFFVPETDRRTETVRKWRPWTIATGVTTGKKGAFHPLDFHQATKSTTTGAQKLSVLLLDPGVRGEAPFGSYAHDKR